jgi:hypothetical protein
MSGVVANTVDCNLPLSILATALNLWMGQLGTALTLSYVLALSELLFQK